MTKSRLHFISLTVFSLCLLLLSGCFFGDSSAPFTFLPGIYKFPPTPTLRSVTGGSANNTLVWDSTPGAISYTIYWKLSAGVTKADNRIETYTSPYTHTQLTPGTVYYYAVAASGLAGEGPLSNEVASIASWEGVKLLGSNTARGGLSGRPATDSQNNVYVYGTTNASVDGNTLTGNTDLFLVKYNSSGTKQWVKQFGLSGKDMIAGAVTVDSADSVYIVGGTYGGLHGNALIGDRDAFVVKYDSSGNWQWTQELGVASLTTSANGVATDSSNNVYISGHTYGGLDGNTLTGTIDFFITKFNSSGVKQWTKQNGVATKYTYGHSIAVDSLNGIYVSGYTNGGLNGNPLTGNQDVFTSKYDASGNWLWTKQMGVATKTTQGNFVTTDSANHVLVVGQTTGGLDGNTLTGTTDFFVIQYDASGNKQWTKQLGVAAALTYGYGVGVDSSDAVYVTGETRGGLDGNSLTGSRDLFITKYSTLGVKQWTSQLGVASKQTTTYGIAIDTSDSVFVAGSTTGSLDGVTLTGSTDMALVKYNSAGTKQWTKLLGSTSARASTTALGVFADRSDNIYFCGNTSGGIDGHSVVGISDIYVAKYNSSGIKQWVQQLGGASNFVFATALVSDSDSNVYVSGSTLGGFDGNAQIGVLDLFITKFNSSGTKQWTRQFGQFAGSLNISHLAIDSSNSLYLAGSSSAGIDGNSLTGTTDAILLKYDSSGTRQWTRQFGAVGAESLATAVTADANGYLYLAGYTDGALPGNAHSGGQDLFLSKFDSSGNRLWIKQLGVAAQASNAYRVATDSLGYVYLAGSTTGNLAGNSLSGATDGVLIKYDSNGDRVWTKLIGGTGAETEARGISVTSNGYLYLSGFTNGSLAGNTLSGSNDVFVSLLDSSGAIQWLRQYGVAGRLTYGLHQTLNSLENVFVAGYTLGDLGGVTLTGAQDAFVMKLDSTGTRH